LPTLARSVVSKRPREPFTELIEAHLNRALADADTIEANALGGEGPLLINESRSSGRK
jgi:hypothetical protein